MQSLQNWLLGEERTKCRLLLRPYTIYLQVDINENEAGGNSVDRGCVTFGLYQGEYSVERQFGSTSDKFDLGMLRST